MKQRFHFSNSSASPLYRMKNFLNLFFICLLSCGCQRANWHVPNNEKEIINSIDANNEAINAFARKGREGACLIRIMTATDDANGLIIRISKRFNLCRYHSSMPTADNLATSQTKGAMNLAEDWVPEEFYLVDGLTDDGVSLARYDFANQNRTILVLYARSEELLHAK